MKKSCFKYITCLFFISLFCIKGLISVCPGLSTQLGKIAGIEKLAGNETDPTEKNAEEKAESEIKEFYLENNHHYTFTDLLFALTIKNTIANNINRKQDVFLPVITPPPEQA